LLSAFRFMLEPNRTKETTQKYERSYKKNTVKTYPATCCNKLNSFVRDLPQFINQTLLILYVAAK